MRDMFMKPRSLKREVRTPSGQMLAGKLHPAMIVELGQSESAVVSQNIAMDLEPIAGRMRSAITGEVNVIFVPKPAVDALKNPEDDLPLNSEAYRKKLIESESVLDLELEGVISQTADVIPRSVSGQKYVSEGVRLAYNVAVNHLRQLAYYKATLLDSASTAIAPALFSQSVLSRYNGVLNPEDRINGSVKLEIANMKLPVEGIGRRVGGTNWTDQNVSVDETTGDGTWKTESYAYASNLDDTAGDMFAKMHGNGIPQIFADLNGAEAGNVSLKDFYVTQRMDKLTRVMDALFKANPIHGQKQALRFAHGLKVQSDNEPFVVYSKKNIFGMSMRQAMDGANLDKEYSNHATGFRYTVPIPRTEFGGYLVTLVSVKPDETLDRMPHPTMTKVTTAKNYLSDEAVIDPVPVLVRDLDADAATNDEETVAMHVGNNHLELNYQSHGFNGATDLLAVANKNAVWSVALPTSLTPESINYPTPVDIYPFVLNDDDDPVANYTLSSVASIPTPLLRGPTPVEEIEIIEDEALFEDFDA